MALEETFLRRFVRNAGTIFAIVAGKTNSKEFSFTLMHLGNNFQNWNLGAGKLWWIFLPEEQRKVGKNTSRNGGGNQHSTSFFSLALNTLGSISTFFACILLIMGIDLADVV